MLLQTSARISRSVWRWAMAWPTNWWFYMLTAPIWVSGKKQLWRAAGFCASAWSWQTAYFHSWRKENIISSSLWSKIRLFWDSYALLWFQWGRSEVMIIYGHIYHYLPIYARDIQAYSIIFHPFIDSSCCRCVSDPQEPIKNGRSGAA